MVTPKTNKKNDDIPLTMFVYTHLRHIHMLLQY